MKSAWVMSLSTSFPSCASRTRLLTASTISRSAAVTQRQNQREPVIPRGRSDRLSELPLANLGQFGKTPDGLETHSLRKHFFEFFVQEAHQKLHQTLDLHCGTLPVL